ncbi:hypothetical protein BJP44_04395 [Candidatus Williamhamiltonella defendens]|nr:hypothetical protein BJP44_04395 [Candidatus Hamiltonella defensa]
MIFLFSGVSVYGVASGTIGPSPEEAFMATGLFVFPFIVINGFSWLKKKSGCLPQEISISSCPSAYG